MDIFQKAQFSLQQNQFLLGTQAFASPPDMASSGVWENVILPKTPTFEGVSGILYFIIFLNFCQIFLLLLTDGKSTVIMLTDVKPTLIKVMTNVIANCIYHCCLADVTAMWYMAIN